MGIEWKHAIVRVGDGEDVDVAAERALLERFDHGWLLVGEEDGDQPGTRDLVFRHAQVAPPRPAVAPAS